MSELTPRLHPLFESTRTICFGRFLMQIPSTASVVYGPAEAETPIEFFEGRGDKVDEHLAQRLAEIEEERQYLLKDDQQTLPLFGKVIEGTLPGQKIAFGSKNQVGYSIYSFVPVGKNLFVQYLDSVLPEDDEVRTFNRVARSLRSRSENEIPAEPGSCIAGGFVPLNLEYERVTIGIRLKEFPDVHLSVDVHKNQAYLPHGSSPKLLRQQAKEFAEADGLGAIFARTKVLRQRERQLGAWKGEEIALRTPEYKDDKEAHEFRFYSTGAINDPMQPELDIRLDTGVKDNRRGGITASVSDEEALALWDSLITTIRLREPRDATPKQDTRAPLGSVVTTGQQCPESGWWESTGERRQVRAGEPMPYVQLLAQRGFLHKLIGARPTRQVPTTWRLVEYLEEPAVPLLAPDKTATELSLDPATPGPATPSVG